MKRIVAGILVLCLVLPLYSVSAPLPERMIVVFSATPDVSLLQHHGGQIEAVFTLIPAAVVNLSPQAVEALSRNSTVKYIEPDTLRQVVDFSVQAKPKPPQVLPWGVDRIDADLAWSVTQGAGIKVGVIDTGIDVDHPDLQANIHGGYNTITHTTNYDDDNGHGTFCSGIIAAVNNRVGVVGVAPEAWLYGVKVLDANGSGTTVNCIEGIQWCVNNGIQIINMSWGSSTDSQALHDACDAAWNAGCILVSGSGGSGVEYPDMYPAAYSTVIAVSATDQNDNKASFSNYGAEIDLAAPGVNIYSTYKGGGYVTMSGIACPHVAGAAALAWAAHPQYSNEQIRQLLENTAEDLGAPGWDIYFGYGLVDAQAVVV